MSTRVKNNTMDTSLADEVLAHLERQITTASPSEPQIDESVIAIYEKVALLLSRYKSGKIPKAFKIIPNLKNWEQIMIITRPENWTPNATFQATKIFLASLNTKLAVKFLSSVLLKKIVYDLDENKKLNPHHYQAIMLAVYKPAAFFKGLIFPICADENTTLKTAAIICSIIKKISIPVLHSAAAILKLVELPYSGPRAIILKSFIEKKYSLPKKAVESVVNYFRNNESVIPAPVLLQQLLLTLCEKYGPEMSQPDRDYVMNYIRSHYHDQISDEIIRALNSSASMLA